MDSDVTWCGDRPRPRRHCVRWGPSSPQKWHSPPFSAHLCCGQTAEWMKMPLSKEVGLGPGDIGVDVNPPPKRGHSIPPTFPLFSPCLLWPNSWIDRDATWYMGRPRPRPHCVRWGPSSPKKGHSSPHFWTMSIVFKRLDGSGCHLV